MGTNTFYGIHGNLQPLTTTSQFYWRFWLCDTDAEKPSSGLNVGDLVFTADQSKIYKATATDTLVELASAAPTQAFPVGAVYLSVTSTNPGTSLGYGTWVAMGAGKMLVGLDAGDPDFDTAEETGGAKTHTLTTTEIPSHTHVQDSHNHTQNAHTHTQDAHTHTQDSHNHTQDAHAHAQRRNSVATGANSGWTTAFDTSSSSPVNDANTGTASVVATNQAATATNQNATATNQNATATNQSATATNQTAGGGGAHSILNPYIVVYIWKRTA